MTILIQLINKALIVDLLIHTSFDVWRLFFIMDVNTFMYLL